MCFIFRLLNSGDTLMKVLCLGIWPAVDESGLDGPRRNVACFAQNQRKLYDIIYTW